MYAAVVATGALGWNVYAFWRARANLVDVIPTFGFRPMGKGNIEVIGVKVINRSDRPVRVTSVWLESQDHSGRDLFLNEKPEGADLPGWIAPNDVALVHAAALTAGCAGFSTLPSPA